MYIALATRPDIAFAVSALSHYNSQPRTSHLTAAKRVLCYPRKTADHCLHFNAGGSDNDGEITGYIDSDWANDSADRKSQGGHVFLYNGADISWQSRKQDLVALSTTEAEYIACSEASREARWLCQLQRDMTDSNDDAEPMRIFSDSRGALATHHNYKRHHEGQNEAHRPLLPQQPRSPCTQNCAIRLRKYGRQPGGLAHQRPAEGKA